MFRRKAILVSVLLVALVQVAVPVSMIVRRELCLRRGDQFKFETRPVDPYDAFRGRYARLWLNASQAPVVPEVSLRRGERVYGWLTVGADGFATFSRFTREAPDDTPYLKVRYNWSSTNETHVELPFDRYYMEESAAPDAERIYRQQAGARMPLPWCACAMASGSWKTSMWVDVPS